MTAPLLHLAVAPVTRSPLPEIGVPLWLLWLAAGPPWDSEVAPWDFSRKLEGLQRLPRGIC